MRSNGRRRAAASLSRVAAVVAAAGIAIAVGFRGGAIRALEPMSHYHDLVAGAGVAGFQDGAFQTARFSSPAGLAVLPRRGLLLVADRANHRVRAIHINEKNRVDTIAGAGTAGTKDGPLATATFFSPSAIAAISDEAFVVSDEGSALLRMVDLAAGTVTTIAGSGSRGVAPGPAREAPLGGVWTLLHVPAERAVYFSQPEMGALRRLDLEKHVIDTVLDGELGARQPAGLALMDGVVCVAFLNGQILRLAPRPKEGGGPPDVEDLGTVEGVRAITVSGGLLYALSADKDGALAWTCVSTGEKGVVSAAIPDAERSPWLVSREDARGGFVADPSGERSFFLTAPSLQSVVCFKHYSFAELDAPNTTNHGGLTDYEYPEKKPAGAFRILLVGDSRMFFFALGKGVPVPSRMETVPKRLELFLSTASALDDGGTRFEVLTLLRVSWEPLLVWPVYHAPDAVERYDVDLVLLMQPPTTTAIDAYLERPITPAGIPVDLVDPEYLLLPHSVKMRKNPAAPLVARAKQLGWLKPHGAKGDQAHIEASLPDIAADSVARRELLTLLVKPLQLLHDSVKHSSPKTKIAMCYFPFETRGTGVLERDLWRDVAKESGIAFLDTVDAFATVKESWFPYSEPGGLEHWTPQGHAFVAYVMAHELLASGLVPFQKGGAVRMKAVEPPTPARPRVTSSSESSHVWMVRGADWKWMAAIGLGGVFMGLGIGLLFGRTRR